MDEDGDGNKGSSGNGKRNEDRGMSGHGKRHGNGDEPREKERVGRELGVSTISW